MHEQYESGMEWMGQPGFSPKQIVDTSGNGRADRV